MLAGHWPGIGRRARRRLAQRLATPAPGKASLRTSSPVPPSPITPLDPNGEYIVFTDSTSGALGLPPMPATYGHYSVSFMGAKGQETIAP